MYLKALEIQGFKSFPDKTVLTFGEDITAIVGPNGSGKSNISDAIRWVMGEQSTRALRGGKMEDVIFGGTAKRKQTGYAEVSLVLDNTSHIFDMEESEVMVTRRYYRSGESEYYINRRSVRLKDVNELFMDTGLGREGYSIIGQGKIDEILSVKSADRREVFEEAAGISRYRHRKEESERKLERTDENLVRINDKISELELQVEPLREQSEKAKKFLVLRDELKGLEISLWLDTLERIRASGIKLEADYQEARRQKEEVKTAQERAFAAAEQYSEEMRQKDMEADRLRFESQGRQAAANSLESAVAVLKNDIQHNLESARRVQADLEQQEGREGSLAAQIQQRRERLAEIEEQIAGHRAELDGKAAQAQEAARSAGTLAQAEQYRQRIEEERRKATEKAQAEARAILEQARDAADRTFKELNEMRRRQEQAKEWIDDNEERAQLRRKLNEADAALGGRKEELPPPPPTRDAVLGDTVELLKMGTQAEVVGVNKDGTLQLQAGILKLKAKQDEVRVLEDVTARKKQSAKDKARAAAVSRPFRTAAAKAELDLRGMMVDEAIGAVDLFLDNALMGKLETVTIIHGKGTGALRKAVREHLKKSRYVKEYRPGVYGEGEDGVTVATLR